MKLFSFAFFIISIVFTFSFRKTTPLRDSTSFAPKENLSEYGFFRGKIADRFPPKELFLTDSILPCFLIMPKNYDS